MDRYQIGDQHGLCCHEEAKEAAFRQAARLAQRNGGPAESGDARVTEVRSRIRGR